MAKRIQYAEGDKGVVVPAKTYRVSSNVALMIRKAKYPDQEDKLTAVQFKKYIDGHVITHLVALDTEGADAAVEVKRKELLAVVAASTEAAENALAELRKITPEPEEEPITGNTGELVVADDESPEVEAEIK